MRPTEPFDSRSTPAATAATAPGRFLQGVSVTRRAMVMLVVLAILILSYASSLRIYLSQQHEMAVARQQIAERSAAIEQLNDEVARWQDPTYVKAQARDRLGWVVPGETGYRVIGPDGALLGGGAAIRAEGALPGNEHPRTWWETLWGSVQVADEPAPVSTPAPRVITLPPTPTPTPAAPSATASR